MKSIAYAEATLGKKMGTPKKLKQEGWKPVKYDVEEVQLDHEIIQNMILHPNDPGTELAKNKVKTNEPIVIMSEKKEAKPEAKPE